MKQNLNVLVIEDDEDDFFLLKHLIQFSDLWEIDFTLATTYNEGLEKYTDGNYDLCFLDHYLGVKTGIEFLKEVNTTNKSIPTILLTGLDNTAIDNEAIESGASDYLPKSALTQSLLERSIRHSIERSKQQKLLITEREKYRKLFYSSLEAVFITNSDFKIIESNSAFQDIFGQDSTISLADIFIKKIDFATLNDFKTQQINSLNNVRITNKDNNELIVDIALTAIDNSEDNLAGNYQGVIHDITDTVESQLKSIESEKFNVTGRLARIIGHEVRNPLTNIILATGELEESSEITNEEDIELFDMIKRSAKRIETLTDELLNSTKLLELNLKTTPVEAVISTAIDTCTDRFTLKKVEVTTPVLTESTLLNLDVEKFQIALTNIIINATEAMAETPQPKLKIDLIKESKSVKIIIKDNGKGMSQTTVEKIFDPFFSGRHGGLGLGMTNTKNILIQHNTLMTVESELGEGTTFTLKLKRPTHSTIS